MSCFAFIRCCIAISLVCASSFVKADWSNELELEYRLFTQEPQFSEQSQNASSIAYKPVWSHVSESGNSVFDFRGLVRYDSADDERSHIDINELTWLYVKDSWEYKAGIGKVYWGVAESQNLVDIINQTDFVESVDGDSKLGQPMISVSKYTEFGAFQSYVLPYFRERTFAGKAGRLRTNPYVNTSAVEYELDKEESHIDYAFRWSHNLGDFDVGVSYFNGTGRDPVFSLSDDKSYLIPTYVQVEQVGLDVQGTFDSWLLKFEAIDRSASERFQGQNFNSAVAGVEYSFFDVLESGIDIGVVAEYSYDKRGNAAPFDDYALIAARFAFNDEQSTDLFFGCSADTTLCLIEGSRRLGDEYKLTLTGNIFSDVADDSIFVSQRSDSYLQLGLSYFF